MVVLSRRGGGRKKRNRSRIAEIEPEDVVVGGNEAGVCVQGGQASGLKAPARGKKGGIASLGCRRRRGRRWIKNVDGGPHGGGGEGGGWHFQEEGEASKRGAVRGTRRAEPSCCCVPGSKMTAGASLEVRGFSGEPCVGVAFGNGLWVFVCKG